MARNKRRAYAKASLLAAGPALLRACIGLHAALRLSLDSRPGWVGYENSLIRRARSAITKTQRMGCASMGSAVRMAALCRQLLAAVAEEYEAKPSFPEPAVWERAMADARQSLAGLVEQPRQSRGR